MSGGIVVTDAPHAKVQWLQELRLSPLEGAALAHVAMVRDSAPGLIGRLGPGGWWFLEGRIYFALRRLERLGLLVSNPNGPPRVGTSGRRTEYTATPDGVLWLEIKAAAGPARAPTRDEWRVVCALGEIDGPATGRGLVDFLEIPDRRLAKAFHALERAGYILVDWRDGDSANFRNWRYTLTPFGKQLLTLRRGTPRGMGI